MPSLTNMAASVSNAMVLMDQASGIVLSFLIQGITRVAGTATAIAPDHSLETGDSVVIAGADQADYNGTFTVTVTDKDTFTFTVANNPVTPATGSISAKCADRSNIATNCTGVQVEKPAVGTTLKVYKRLHPQASWVQEGTDITSASSTTIVVYHPPMGFVRVVRTAGAGDSLAFARKA